MDDIDRAMKRCIAWLVEVAGTYGHVPSIIYPDGRKENFTGGDLCPISTARVVEISEHLGTGVILAGDLLKLRTRWPWPRGAYYSSTLRKNVMPNYVAHIASALHSCGHNVDNEIGFLKDMIDHYGVPPDTIHSPWPLRSNGRYPFWQAQIATVLLEMHRYPGAKDLIETAEKLYNALLSREQKTGYPAEYFTDDSASQKVHPAGMVAMSEIEILLNKKRRHLDMAIDMLHNGLFHQYYSADMKPYSKEYDIMPTAHLGILLVDIGEDSLASEIMSSILSWQHESGGFPGLPGHPEKGNALYVWDTVWALKFMAQYRGGWPDN